jgi:hypothetical protein
LSTAAGSGAPLPPTQHDATVENPEAKLSRGADAKRNKGVAFKYCEIRFLVLFE